MNNFGIAFKKFITNKNTVTIIGIIVILVLLYWGYDRTVKKSVDPINVPVAKSRITAGHEITFDDISYKKVSRITIDKNVLTNASLIVGKYTNVGVTIPQGSMFYSDWLVNKENVPGKWIEKVDFANGEEAYYFNTNTVKTLGNSVLPDSYIDIYFSKEYANKPRDFVLNDLDNLKDSIIQNTKVKLIKLGNNHFIALFKKNDLYMDIEVESCDKKLFIKLIESIIK